MCHPRHPTCMHQGHSHCYTIIIIYIWLIISSGHIIWLMVVVVEYGFLVSSLRLVSALRIAHCYLGSSRGALSYKLSLSTRARARAGYGPVSSRSSANPRKEKITQYMYVDVDWWHATTTTTTTKYWCWMLMAFPVLNIKRFIANIYLIYLIYITIWSILDSQHLTSSSLR